MFSLQIPLSGLCGLGPEILHVASKADIQADISLNLMNIIFCRLCHELTHKMGHSDRKCTAFEVQN